MSKKFAFSVAAK